MTTLNNVDEVRKQVEGLGGSVGVPTPMANWIELHGVFTPDQLRKLAKAVEKQYGNQKRSNS